MPDHHHPSACTAETKLAKIKGMHPKGDPKHAKANMQHLHCMAKQLPCDFDKPHFMAAHKACEAKGLAYHHA